MSTLAHLSLGVTDDRRAGDFWATALADTEGNIFCVGGRRRGDRP